ncbi:MAG: hypothetical protein U1F67_01915 [Rubrivivax sp.]
MKAANYPNLLSDDVPGMAVKAFLVTYDYNLAGTQGRLAQFARSLCTNFEALQSQGHPKGRKCRWSCRNSARAGPTTPQQRELGRCASTRPPPKPVRACSTEQKILGLCE